jgi:hypothetical protein
MHTTFTARYREGLCQTGGRCPIAAGVAGRLTDHGCRCGRLPFDRTPPCGCWPQEPAAVVTLSARSPATASTARAAGRHDPRWPTPTTQATGAATSAAQMPPIPGATAP